MASKIAGKIFSETDGKLILTVPYAEVMIPSSYFKDGIARWIGDRVSTLCIFEFVTFTSENAKSGVKHLMSLPLEKVLSFSSHYEDGKGEDKMVILQLRKGDVFMDSMDVTRSAESTKSFIKLLHSGHMPEMLPYDQVLRTYMDSLEINGVDLEVPFVILENIISEIYRNAKDITVPARKIAGLPGAVLKPVNLKRLAQLNSTFAAISFEDMGQSIVTSIGRSKKGIKDAESPVEKSILY
jgi:hypothetical protein